MLYVIHLVHTLTGIENYIELHPAWLQAIPPACPHQFVELTGEIDNLGSESMDCYLGRLKGRNGLEDRSKNKADLGITGR